MFVELLFLNESTLSRSLFISRKPVYISRGLYYSRCRCRRPIFGWETGQVPVEKEIKMAEKEIKEWWVENKTKQKNGAMQQSVNKNRIQWVVYLAQWCVHLTPGWKFWSSVLRYRLMDVFQLLKNYDIQIGTGYQRWNWNRQAKCKFQSSHLNSLFR